MARLLLLAATTGYQVRVFADAARRLGIELTLATDRCRMMDDPWGDHAVAVRFHEPRASGARLAEIGGFDAVVAVGDRPTLVAAEAAARLNIPYHPPAAVRACHDKHLARQLFRQAGMPVPEFFRMTVADDPRAAATRAPYPCVLKPLGLSASRGVIRANHPNEFLAAFERIKALLASPDVKILREQQNRYLQVESFITGREFAIEGLVTGGRLQTLAIFDKPDPLDGPFFEETIYVTPSRQPAEVQRALIASAQDAIQALGLTHGPVHAELRFDGRTAWMLEAAARPIGGLCAKALSFENGMPLEELIIRHAQGENTANARLEPGASGVMMIPVKRAGIYQQATGAEQPGVEIIITAKPGQEIKPLPEGSTYLGFIFARRESPAEVEAALRRAHAKLDFQIATALETLHPV